MASDDGSFLAGYLPYLLRQADQTLSAPFYAVLTEYGVARSEWRVLAVLQDVGELGVVELANAALSPQPTVTHALRRLEERGLVRRRGSEADRRQRLVSITPSGSSLATALMGEARQLATTALADAGDLAPLAAQLRELTATVEATIERQATSAAEAEEAG